MDSMPTHTWPGWQAVRCLGQGAYGSVYEIHRQTLGEVEKAALKVITIPQKPSDIQELRNEGYDEHSIRIHFEDCCNDIVREYAMMMKMKGHGNIVYCDDYRTLRHPDGIGWTIYIKMELLTPMTDTLDPGNAAEDTVRIGMDLSRALIACREHSILHRDIKPQNIFRSADGGFKLGDFGIAKTVERTAGGTRIGTYKYVAPEIFRGQDYGAQADIYSLGIVMYWMLNHHRMPFVPLPPAPISAGAEEQARARRLAGEHLPPPALGSEALKRIVLKACAFSPAERYASAAQLLADLQSLSGLTSDANVSQSTIRQNSLYSGQKQHSQNSLSDPPRKKTFPWAITAVIALLLIVAGILCWLLFGRTEELPKETDPIHTSASKPEVPMDPLPSDSIPPATTLPSPTEPEDTLYQQVLTLCSQWESQGDFPSAVRYLNGLTGEQLSDPRYQALLADYREKLRQSVLAQAEVLVEQGNYPDALTLLSETAALHSCPDYTSMINAITAEFVTWCSKEGCTQLSFDQSRMHSLNSFLSSFSEQEFWETKADGTSNYRLFRSQTASTADLLEFSIRFAKRNQYNTVRAMRLDGTDYTAIPISELTWSANRFLSRTLTAQDAAALGYTVSGDYLCLPPFEAAPFSHVTIAESVWETPEGYHLVFFRIYEASGSYLDSQGRINGYSVYSNTAASAASDSKLSYHASGVALLRPYTRNNKPDHQLLNYRILSPAELRRQTEDPQDALVQAVADQCASWAATGDYLRAVQYLSGLADTDSRYAQLLQFYEQQLSDQVLSVANGYAADGQYRMALKTIYDARSSYDCEAYTQAITEIQQVYSTHRIAASKYHSMYVHTNGTVSLVGYSEKTGCSADGWSNVISAATGDEFIAGLRGDGTVVGSGYNLEAYADSSGWRNITVLTAGDSHLAALRSDGTVVVTDDYLKDDHRISELYTGSPIVSVAAGWRFTVALHADGTVTATGRNEQGQCNVHSWTDIVAISCGSEHTVGLKADGTVVIAGSTGNGQKDVTTWTGINAISAGDYLTLGLKYDGSVLALGQDQYDQCKEAKAWKNIVEIAGGSAHNLGRTANGTTVSAGTAVNDLKNTSKFMD